MEKIEEDNNTIYQNRIQNALRCFSKCQSELSKENGERKCLKERNAKLEIQLKETRELEKSHRYHLCQAREMIGNLQETVSNLMHLKRDMSKFKEQLNGKDIIISTLQKEKLSLVEFHKNNLNDIRASHEKFIQDIKQANEEKIQQVQHDCETKIAHCTCVIEELRANIKEMETEHADKMNVLVLEYEENIQRSTAQIAQLQEQNAALVARTDANIDAYRRRLKELEEKLKQTQFKQHLVQGTFPHYENLAERPYSANRDPIPNSSRVIDQDFDTPKSRILSQTASSFTPNKPSKFNKLQVMYHGNEPQNTSKNEKGNFSIAKKRKLYNANEFQDF